MTKKREENLIIGLDIGTSKVLAIVGEVSPDGDIEIIGTGHHPARGMRKGVVANIESTVNSIQRAVEEAELIGRVPDLLGLRRNRRCAYQQFQFARGRGGARQRG